MKKIIEINVEMPYHSETYTVGEEASGASRTFYKGGIIKEIKRVIGEETVYLITTEKGITLELKNSQQGLRIIWGDE
ncbi:hypothetical protein [Fusobacterium vincentii ATCC 49256]|uniref:Uncharacterized protein n=1 Tax=Fusobacterium vincentii ATCC 49256 TaxID=209882 RepID=Q7P5U1_FUSVC|nr:hypothetical protein [Fusobacterium vincentii ATCC 49256]